MGLYIVLPVVLGGLLSNYVKKKLFFFPSNGALQSKGLEGTESLNQQNQRVSLQVPPWLYPMPPSGRCQYHKLRSDSKFQGTSSLLWVELMH